MKTRRSGIGSILSALMVATLVGVAPAVADAQPRPHENTTDKAAEARTHFQAGRTKYDAGDWAGAYTEFLAADHMLPHPRPERFLAESADKLRRYNVALENYEKFLRSPPADLASDATAAKARVAELRKTVPQANVVVLQKGGEGERAFKAGQYDKALASLTAADQAMVTPRVSWFLAQTYENLGRPAEAVPFYDAFLLDPPRAMAKEETDGRERVAKIRAMPGKVHVESSPPGATVLVDGTPGTRPTPNDYEVAPGHHMLMVTMEGREPKELPVDVTFASTQRLPTVELAEKKPLPPIVTTPVVATTTVVTPPPPPPPPPEPRSKVPAYITGGLAIAGAAVGTVFGVLALNDKSDYKNNPTTSKADDGESHALIADMAFFVAVTLGVTSIVLLVTKDEAPEAAANAARNTARAAKPKKTVTFQAAPIVTPHGGGAGALIRF